MKTKLISTAVFFLVSCLLVSCTIQKRVHLPGYYFAWNNSVNHPLKQHQKKIAQENKNPEVETEAPLALALHTISAQANYAPVEHKKNNLRTPLQIKPAPSEIRHAFTSQSYPEKEIMPAPPESNQKPINPMVLLGLIFFILGHVPFLQLLWLLGIIFTFIGRHKMKKYPDKWRGERIARTVLTIAAVEIILALIFVLLLLVLFPNGISLGG